MHISRVSFAFNGPPIYRSITETKITYSLKYIETLKRVVSSNAILKHYIYILNVAALDETIIPSCLHFSMQNIEQSRGLGRASRWSNVNVNQ